MSIATTPTDYSPAPKSLEGKIILVTGAGSGIGRTAALTYAKHGATVILLGRTMKKLEAVYDEIEAQGYPQAAIYPIDFEGATEKDYIDMCNTLDENFGHLDGILHNASELGHRTALDNYCVDTWKRLLQINLTAPFILTQKLMPLLHRAPNASIIFTSASVGRQGHAYWGAYAATKAAIENLMQTLADEQDGRTQIRCNSLNPGATRTQMRASAYPAEDPNTLATPEDIMPVYLYLMGGDSKEINGQQFNAQKTN